MDHSCRGDLEILYEGGMCSVAMRTKSKIIK